MHLQPTFTRPFSRIETMRSGNEVPDARHSGFKELDSILYGSQKGKLYIIPVMLLAGRSTFLINLLHNMMLQSRPSIKVTVFLLGQSARDFLEQLLTNATEIWLEKFIGTKIGDHEWETTKQEGINRLLSAHLSLEDEADMCGVNITHKCAELINGNSPDIIIIDNLQLIKKEKGLNPDEKISSILSNLSDLAKTSNIPIAVLSQWEPVFENELVIKCKHQLSDMQKAGHTWPEADEVLFPYRLEYSDIIEEEKDESLLDATFISFTKKQMDILASLLTKAQLYISKYVEKI